MQIVAALSDAWLGFTSHLEIAAFLISLAAFAVSYVAFRMTSDPEVLVYAVPDPRRPSIVLLVVENMGKGIARDISFVSNRPLPENAWGISLGAAKPRNMTAGPLISGIAFLYSGEKRVTVWGQYGGLVAGLGGGPVDVTAKFYSNPAFRLWRRKHSVTSTIDIKSFERSDASDFNYDKRLAEAVESIAKRIVGPASWPQFPPGAELPPVDDGQDRADEADGPPPPTVERKGPEE